MSSDRGGGTPQEEAAETLTAAPRVVSLSPFGFFSAFYDKPDRIEEGLFLGGIGSVSNKEQLEELNISAVLTVARGFPPRFPESFQYTLVEVMDDPKENLLQHFDKCFKAIDEGREKGGIVVHCMAGVSRSATIVVAYIMRLYSIKLAKALAYVKRCRSIVCPNPGFMRQLEQFEAKLEAERKLKEEEPGS